MPPRGLPRRSLKTRITVATLLVFVASLWAFSLYAIAVARDGMDALLAAPPLLLTLLAGGYTGWWLRRELRALRLTAQALNDRAAANEAPNPLPVERTGEIGQLVTGFNRLLETLGRRNAELQHSADLLNEAQRVAGLGSYVLDVAGRHWRSSEVLDAIFGIDRDFDRSIEGWLVLVHPEDRDMLARYFADEVVGRRQRFDKTYRIVRHGDGAVRWVHGLGRLDLDAQGLPVAMHGTIQDVTERVLTEAALRESHEMLGGILATTKDGFWRIDPQGVLIDVNPAYCRLSGYTRDELIGRHVSQIDTETAEAVKERIDRIRETGSEQFETVHRRRDGTLWNVEVSATACAAREGEFLAFLRDISERKWALEVAEKRIVSLTQPLEGGAIAIEDLFTRDELQRVQDDFSEATGVASIITYPDGTPFTRPSNFTRFCYDIIRATEKGRANCQRSDCALGRYHPSGPLVQPCLSGGLWDAGVSISVGGHHVASWLIGQVRDETQNAASMRAYARQIGADEESLAAALNDVPAMSRGRFEVIARALFALANQLSTIAYQNVQQARFITDRRRVAEELEQHRNHLEELVASRTEELERERQVAEAASRAKSTFLANMSHEIRTPLNGIVGMTHILRRGVVTAVQADRLDKIDTAARHLLSTINDILDLSKIEAGKVVLDAVPFKVGSVLANVRSIIEERAAIKGLHLEVAPSDFLPELCGDPTRLLQALLTDVGYAVKLTQHGSVRLCARLLDEDAESVLLRFEVEDTGIGIPEDVVARLFNAFEQAEGATTRKYGGTGLGLAITRRLAELMGGEAGVRSSVGVGSTFWFTARLARNAGKSATPAQLMTEAERKLRQRHRGRRILLADDEPLNLEVARFLLEDVGLVVVTAADGLEALAQVEQMDFAAILMDMQMPNLDGVNATRRIRALPDGAGVPILAMTANAFAEDRALCLDAGMNDFLAKPFVPEALFSCLLRWLEPGNDLLGIDHALLVGVPAIDDEHRMLVSYLDDLVNDPAVPLGSAQFRKALDTLGERIVAHFANEERLVRSFGVPDEQLTPHVAAHAEIVAQFGRLCDELDGGAAVDRAGFVATVRRWIIDHVVAHDLSIRDHVPSRRKGDR